MNKIDTYFAVYRVSTKRNHGKLLGIAGHISKVARIIVQRGTGCRLLFQPGRSPSRNQSVHRAVVVPVFGIELCQSCIHPVQSSPSTGASSI